MIEKKVYQTPNVEIHVLLAVDCLILSANDNDVTDKDWDFSQF